MTEPSVEIFHRESVGNRINALVSATRPAFLSASVLPVVVGVALSWHLAQRFDLGLALATLLSIVFIHAGSNVLNDYFDARNGSDDANTDRIYPFTGGSRFIQNGVHSVQQTLAYGSVLLVIGGGLGLWLTVLTGWPLLIIGLIGGLLAIFYSAPPCLTCRGLGDVTIAISFGVLPLMGTVFIQTGQVHWMSAWVGSVIGWFAAAILWINSIPDINADRLAQKMSLPARLGASTSGYGLGVLFTLGLICLLAAPLPNTRYFAVIAMIPATTAAVKAVQGNIPSAIPLTIVSHAVLCGSMAVSLLLA